MKTKKTKKTLKLNKETIINLENNGMSMVYGGSDPDPDPVRPSRGCVEK